MQLAGPWGAIRVERDQLGYPTIHAKDLAEAGKLSNDAVMKFVKDGLSPMSVASLAVKASIPVEAIAEVVRSASAKGMLAVAWAGDFSAAQAETLQFKIARVMPDQIIRSKKDGWFDATQAELEWQLNLFKDVTVQTRASA